MEITSRETLISLDGVTKVFVTDEVETHALSGIHLNIARGEYVSIAGPSGCGKSTLLAILGLLDTPSGGTYRSTSGCGMHSRWRTLFRHTGSKKYAPAPLGIVKIRCSASSKAQDASSTPLPWKPGGKSARAVTSHVIV